MVRESLSEKVHLSRFLNGVREGNGNNWEKNVSARNACGRALRQEHAWQIGGPTRKQCGWNRVGGGQSGHG